MKIVKTTICGTDLPILKGDVPTCAPGRILGHEGIGVIEKARIASMAAGSLAAGSTAFRRNMSVFPSADTSLYHVPAGADEDALVMLSDILPAGFECGVRNGKVQHHGRPRRKPPRITLRRHDDHQQQGRQGGEMIMKMTVGRLCARPDRRARTRELAIK